MTALLALAAALALVLGPGCLVGVASGLRWRTALAAGPALGCGVVGVGTQMLSRTDRLWTPTAAAVCLLGVVATLLLLRGGGGVVRRRKDDTRRIRWTATVGRPRVADVAVAVVAAVPVLLLGLATRGFSAIPQRWDAVFHGAATRFIADTGRAGPGDLAAVSQPANPHFYYPDTYHALAALLVRLHVADVPRALDSMSAATAAAGVVGIAVLSARLLGGCRTAAVAGAVAAAASWAFPYRVLAHGPLLPFALGVALIPGLMVLADRVALPGRGPRPLPGLALGLGLVGAWSVHPSVALAAAIPLAVQGLRAVVAGEGLRGRAAAAAPFVLAVLPPVAFVVATVDPAAADGMATFSWPREVGVLRAAADVLDSGPTLASSIALSVCLLLGLVAAARDPRLRGPLLAPVVMAGALVVLYVLAAAVEGAWVRVITGYWWDDAGRFSALLVVPASVLAAAGVRFLVGEGGRRAASRLPAVVLMLAAAAAAVSGWAVVPGKVRDLGYGDGPAVTAGERRVLDALGAHYRGGTALDDPFDGMAWAYALHGVPVVFPTPLADDPDRQEGPDRMYLYTSINRYGYDPRVAATVRALDVRWVLVGTRAVGGPGRPPGFAGLHLNPHLRLVVDDPGARLYEVLPVDPARPPQAPPPGIPAVVQPVPPPDSDSPVVR